MKLDLTSLRAFIATALASTTLSAFGQTANTAATVRPPDYKAVKGDSLAGKALFNDTHLSTNGMSCASCHANHGAFSASFAKPYPHIVAMARDQLGRQQMNLDEMVQACMVMPMSAKPLPWKSKALADITTYVDDLQSTFKPPPITPVTRSIP